MWHFTLTNKYNKILRPDYRGFCSWYKTVFFSVQKLKFNPPWAEQIVWLTWIYRILLLLCCVAPPFITEMSDRKRIKTSSPTFIERTARLKNSNVSSQFFFSFVSNGNFVFFLLCCLSNSTTTSFYRETIFCSSFSLVSHETDFHYKSSS